MPQAYYDMGPPTGRKARWGKEERRRVGGLTLRKRGDPTCSAARDDAYAQKERHGGEPYRPSPLGDSATPLGDLKFGHKILLTTFLHGKVGPAGQAY